jgi:hypothetical protein
MLHAAAIAILPLLTLLAGVSSLYVDPQKSPKKRWMFLVILFVTAGASIVFGVQDDHDKTMTFKTMTDGLSAVHNDTGSILSTLASYGVNTKSLVDTAASANKARAAILPTVLSNGVSNNITVVYYPKDVDGPVVLNALREGGFKTETHLGNPANANLGTNAIWIGDSVTVDQAKFVALTVVRAGVKIVSIRRFGDGSGAKANRIEVGTDKAQLSDTPMEVSAIASLSAISRDTTSGGPAA